MPISEATWWIGGSEGLESPGFEELRDKFKLGDNIGVVVLDVVFNSGELVLVPLLSRNWGPNEGEEMVLLEAKPEPKAGNFGGKGWGELAFRAEEGVENTMDSFFTGFWWINDTPSGLAGRWEALNVALGPNSFDMVSNAPAACTAADDDRALDKDDVVDNRSGDVILCKPGANWVGVDDG